MGKFSNEADEMVYEISLDGCCETEGDVDGPGFFARVKLSPIQGKLIASRLGFGADDTAPRSAIMEEDSQGFVTVHYFDTDEGEAVVWAGILRQVEEFYDETGELPGDATVEGMRELAAALNADEG